MTIFASFTAPKHEHRFLATVLITLHIALWWQHTFWWSQTMLLLHFACFFLWQPLWSRRTFSFSKSNLILISGLIGLVFLSRWSLTCWQIILIGLLSGRDLVKLKDRWVNAAAIIFLLLDLLTLNIHQLIILTEPVVLSWLEHDSHWLLGYGLLVIPLSFLLVTTDDSLEHRYYIDFFHGLTFTLLTLIIILGSLTMMHYGQATYPFAVFTMSLGVALFILVLSWIWLISIGENGIDQLWIKHLFNIGHSFEQWLDNLARPESYKSLSPDAFLKRGFEQLLNLPWVTGIIWRSPQGDNHYGEVDKEQVVIFVRSIEVTVFSSTRIGGSHYFFIKVLIQLLEYFYQTKRREESLAQQAHLQAIHETGAKLTHDIKNLLQSLHAVSSAIETCQPSQFGDTQRLLQHQMPHLTQRLKRTLDKLQKPTELSYSNIPISVWWENLRARYSKLQVDFIEENSANNASLLVPENLFDNVMENLLQNALMKRKREPKLKIEVILFQTGAHTICLTVCDDGTPIPDEIAKNLLHQPVSSRDGFGIGLYQAAKQIAHTNYRLHLKENKRGGVCFELTNEKSSEDLP